LVAQKKQNVFLEKEIQARAFRKRSLFPAVSTNKWSTYFIEKKSWLTNCNNNATGSQKEKNNIKENFSFHDPIKLRAVGYFRWP